MLSFCKLYACCIPLKQRSLLLSVTHRSIINHLISGPADNGEFPQLARAYEPAVVESCSADSWTTADDDVTAGRRFSMVLPPPNVTGKLHLGHALTLAIQDAICRWRRMCGDQVMWVPGTDHAGIATQVIVEKKLWAEQRKTRHSLGRDEFVRQVWRWRLERSEQIHRQMRALGVTLNWDRSVFTMDPSMSAAVSEVFVRLFDAGQSMSAAVSEAFVRLFDAGQVYRTEALVNWCCQLQSAVSDIEVEHRTVDGTMYDIAYCWDQDASEELVVSTTRPETLLGDTAVAVSPGDARLRCWVGRRVTHPLRAGRPSIPVLADDAVHTDVGTGALKITPAHDPTDFEVGRRHGLEVLNILTEDGRINENGGQFQGLRRDEAREAVLAALKGLGLYRGERPHQLNQPVCSRTGDVIEPMVKHQWFVRCGEMAAEALRAVEEGELLLDPPSLENIWRQWLSEGRDWCVSRQLWWGHRIPAFCATLPDGSQRWTAAASAEEALRKLGLSEADGVSIRQDEDVLDTWFSSALFPFAVFGWPQQTAELSRWYPLSLMETGHDILFFWVARMVMLGQCLTGQLPFQKVLLHGLVCDAHGRKMSKSLGNVIDPDHVIEGATLDQLHQQVRDAASQGYISPEEATKARQNQQTMYPEGIPACGADALRLALCSADLRRSFISLDVREARQARLFGNKLWQAARFVMANVAPSGVQTNPDHRLAGLLPASAADRWMLSCLAACVDVCGVAMETHSLHRASAALQQLLYRQFCDVYLEAVKPVLRAGSAGERRAAEDVLLTVLDTGLRLLHPLMPRLTQHLAQHLAPLTGRHGCQLRQPYPEPPQLRQWRDRALEDGVTVCLDAVRALRAAKTKYNIAKATPEVWLETTPDPWPDLATLVSTLARCQVRTAAAAPAECLLLQGHRWKAHLLLQGHVDVPAELERLRTKITKIEKKMAALDALMLTNKFRRKPAKMRNQEIQRRALMEEELSHLRESQEDVQKLAKPS